MEESDSDRYDSSVYSDDDDYSINTYDEENEQQEYDEFLEQEKIMNIKVEENKIEHFPKVDTKIPEINPWTKKKQGLDTETKITSLEDIIKQQTIEEENLRIKELEDRRRKELEKKKPNSILLNRKKKTDNNKIMGFKKRTFNYQD